ncbi:Zn-ribbon protein, possibly nucleic acid-binding protein [Mycolicibacterium rhodesiae NBB3]|jgi:predicted  nucleic acid-binding Zn-ribbon protein|uniref:Zn-ribbon protein, possibly nucleic acid-binding protein n=1 Tax=Mycolicibacterium rhodesiae (strain NBB3) TaxID=710685 RepID=G8RMU4_MYCRN|nr:C4-type zinc ribbon domain-containing protein [Mycolicibacterium rhodesiae]AEV74948.1 Zn-ribbon protein, possibly nucleic acid-binding protein [Mycolicibacterium rhodesiae NBB3]
MKAEVIQQRSLLELAELDAERARIEHRAGHLVELQRLEEIQAMHREANDRLAALQIALEDLDEQVRKFEAEIDAVRQREDRDRGLLDSGATDAKQLTELQHELETLERRQSSLEDSLLEVMERREELQTEQAAELTKIDELQRDLGEAQQAYDDARSELDQLREQSLSRRDELVAGLDPDLVALYERQRTGGGAGAGLLQGGRCGACRIEIDRGELARISAAAEDDVLRCPECGAILLRVKGSGK